MWIRILGILYNLSLVQAIEYSTKDKILYLYHGACGVHQGHLRLMDTTEISFNLPHYDDYGLNMYKVLVKLLLTNSLQDPDGYLPDEPVKPIRKVGIVVK